MQRRYATPEPLSERVLRQLARKFRYFDVEVSKDKKKGSIYYPLSIYDKKQRNPHRRDPHPVAEVWKFLKAGDTAYWYKIESVNEGARPYWPYVKKLVGIEFGSRPQLEMAVRHEAFEYEAHRLLVKEAENVLRKEAENVLRRNSPSNDSAR